jgi:hypothetical protein
MSGCQTGGDEVQGNDKDKNHSDRSKKIRCMRSKVGIFDYYRDCCLVEVGGHTGGEREVTLGPHMNNPSSGHEVKLFLTNLRAAALKYRSNNFHHIMAISVIYFYLDLCGILIE